MSEILFFAECCYSRSRIWVYFLLPQWFLQPSLWKSISHRYKNKTTRTFEHRREAWRVLVLQKYELFSIPQVFWRKNGFLSSKTIRKQSHFTQKELAELSGVTLRMIQAYEQGDQDIMKAKAQTVFALARVLGCRLR